MDENDITHYITSAMGGIEVVEASGNKFFFYDPDGVTRPDSRFPFVTLVTNDDYDQASNLSRPGVYRLNIGVSKETYRSLLGEPPVPVAAGYVETGHDFTALDQIMPHPVYAPQLWVCVLSPSKTTFEKVRPLLAEAHARAVKKHPKSG